MLLAIAAALLPAQELAPIESTPPEPSSIQRIQPPELTDGISNDRIMGVIPNFSTVSDPNLKPPPLTVREKFKLFVKETDDPFTFVSAAMGAGMSQFGDKTPKYGDGVPAYSQRVGAAFTDMATQNFFSDAVLASVLHEDPRYYRMGPSHSIPVRIGYAISRLVIGRTDSGKLTFNFSGVGGMAMGIVLSNAYYPGPSVSRSVTEGRFISSISSNGLGNLLPEFWPDFKQKLDHLRHKDPAAHK
jgi:hypothetical protein